MSRQTRNGWLVRVFGIFALVTLAGGAATVQAQEATISARPALYGHGFTESVDVPSPFVRSFIRNRLGTGKAFDLETVVYDLNGEPVVGVKGDLIFAILDFEYQYALKPWIAIRARIMGSGRLGSDTLALLSEGVTMSTGFEFGWLVRMYERERTALSLDLNMADRTFTGVNIGRFVEDIIAGDPAQLVRKTPSARGSLGLRFAWAASPLLGVSARASSGYGESVDRNEGDVWFWRLGGSLDFDLRTRTSLPMGVAVGHVYDTFPELGGDIAEGIHSTFVRLSYVGREDFMMSLDLSHDRIPIAGDRPNIKGGTVTISMRYYI